MGERKLGNRLKEARMARNLTQADLAAQIGVFLNLAFVAHSAASTFRPWFWW